MGQIVDVNHESRHVCDMSSQIGKFSLWHAQSSRGCEIYVTEVKHLSGPQSAREPRCSVISLTHEVVHTALWNVRFHVEKVRFAFNARVRIQFCSRTLITGSMTPSHRGRIINLWML